MFIQALDESSGDWFAEDDIFVLLREISTADYDVDPFMWLGDHAKRFLSLALLTKNVLSIQASNVESESNFSRAGTLIGGNLWALADDTISANMRLRLWQKVMDLTLKFF